MTTAPVRSYHARRGRLSPALLDALDRLGPRYAIEPPPEGEPHPLDLATLVPHARRWVVEIGSGLGDAAAAMAHAEPGTAILAVDVHTRGIARLLQRIDSEGLTNVRVVRGDAVRVLRDLLAPQSLDGVRVWFPDPWPKARHHKRRLVQPAFVRLVVDRLRPGGSFHAATDWDDYARAMRTVLDAEPLLRCCPGSGRPPWRPVTPYERAGLAAGRTITDLVYARVPGTPS